MIVRRGERGRRESRELERGGSGGGLERMGGRLGGSQIVSVFEICLHNRQRGMRIVMFLDKKEEGRGDAGKVNPLTPSPLPPL